MNLRLLNTELNTELTIKSEPIKIKKELVFPSFEKKTIYDASGNPIEGFSAITNSKDLKVNAVMSNSYTIFNHEQAFEVMDKAVRQIAPEAKSNIQFHKNDGFMKVEYNLPEKYNVQVGEGDSLRTRLVGMNSVDGSKCLSFHVDFERLVCANGMKGFNREFSFTRKHSRFIHEDTHEFDIAAQLDTAWTTIVANAHTLKNNAIDYNAGMALIKEVINRKLFPQKLEAWISEEWRRTTSNANSIQVENGSNLWTLYNSFTSAITHSTDKKGNTLSVQQKDLLGDKINSVIFKLVA